MRILQADTHLKKLKGLIGKKNINYGMIFYNVKSIHTFFMKESIDIVGINNDYIITEIHPNIKPNKIIILKKSIHTIELPNNYSKKLKIGMHINNKDI